MIANLMLPGLRSLLTLVLSATALSCLAVNADVSEIAVARENLVFQGVPEDVAVLDDIPADVRARYGLPALGEAYHFPSQPFTYDRVPIDMPSGMTSDLRVKEVTIRAHEGSPGLSFVRGLRLTVSRPSEPVSESVILMEYPEVGTTPARVDRSLTLKFNGDWSPVDPWKADSSVYTLDVWAVLTELPRQDWAVDVELTLRGSLNFKNW